MSGLLSTCVLLLQTKYDKAQATDHEPGFKSTLLKLATATLTAGVHSVIFTISCVFVLRIACIVSSPKIRHSRIEARSQLVAFIPAGEPYCETLCAETPDSPQTLVITCRNVHILRWQFSHESPSRVFVVSSTRSSIPDNRLSSSFTAIPVHRICLKPVTFTVASEMHAIA